MKSRDVVSRFIKDIRWIGVGIVERETNRRL
jgi:hypothetical protein